MAGGLLSTLHVNTACPPMETSTAGREGEKAGRPVGRKRMLSTLCYADNFPLSLILMSRPAFRHRFSALKATESWMGPGNEGSSP